MESESFADGAAYGPSLVVSAVATAALLHGLYNSFLDLGALGAALLLDAGTVLLAIAGLSHLKKLSPFAEFPFSEYRLAIPQLKEALRHNPDNFVLHKRLGLHYIRAAASCLRYATNWLPVNAVRAAVSWTVTERCSEGGYILRARRGFAGRRLARDWPASVQPASPAQGRGESTFPSLPWRR